MVVGCGVVGGGGLTLALALCRGVVVVGCGVGGGRWWRWRGGPAGGDGEGVVPPVCCGCREMPTARRLGRAVAWWWGCG